MGLHSRILVSGLFITLASLPFSQFGTSAGAVLIALSFVIAAVKRDLHKPKSTIFTALTALFIWTVLGLFWTENFSEGLATINIKLPLFIFPLALFTVNWDSNRWKRPLATTFLTSTFMAALYGLANGYLISDNIEIRTWSPFISHIRMGLMLSLGLGILLLEKKYLLSLIYGGVAILSIWHTQSVTGLLMLGFVTFYAVATRLFPRFRTLAIGIASFGLICFILSSLYLYSTTVYSEHLDQTTPWGNSYVHHPSKHLKENGYKVWNHLCEEEVQIEWNKRSECKYYSTDKNGFTVRDRVVRYMTSLGVPKNGEEVQKLSDQDIKNIENGHTSIRMSTHTGMSLRLDALKFELGNYFDGGDPSGNSVTMRIEAFKTGLHIVSSNLFLGVGTGDLPDEFGKAYVETGSKLKPKFWKRTHNQYLAWWIALGVVGFVVWIFVLASSFSFTSDIGRMAWWVLSISCLAEDTLETQAGVTFAALILTLFASINKWKS